MHNSAIIYCRVLQAMVRGPLMDQKGITSGPWPDR